MAGMEERVVREIRRHGRIRSIGPCPRCGGPVTLGDDHVRLWARVWHLNCAIESGRAMALPVKEESER